eukprot:1359207-Alexandrium_andersonii.AAC.1
MASARPARAGCLRTRAGPDPVLGARALRLSPGQIQSRAPMDGGGPHLAPSQKRDEGTGRCVGLSVCAH